MDRLQEAGGGQVASGGLDLDAMLCDDIVAVLIVVTQVLLNGKVKPEDGDRFITVPEEMGGGFAMP